LLVRTTGLDVEYADIEALAEQGPLAVRGRYKGWPLYDGDPWRGMRIVPFDAGR